MLDHRLGQISSSSFFSEIEHFYHSAPYWPKACVKLYFYCKSFEIVLNHWLCAKLLLFTDRYQL